MRHPELEAEMAELQQLGGNPRASRSEARVDVCVEYEVRQFNRQQVEIQDIAVARNVNIAAAQPAELARVQVAEDCAQAWAVTLAPITLENVQGVQFGTPNAAAAPTVGDERGLRVLVTWGVEAAKQSCEVDYPTNGGTFLVHGSAVQVESVFPFTVLGVPPVGARKSITLGASITPASAHQNFAKPTLTVAYGSMVPQSTRTFPIPTFARRVRWTISQNTNLTLLSPEMWLRQDADTAGPLVSYAVEPFGGNSNSTVIGGLTIGGWPNGGWWQIHPQARFMVIFNNEPAIGGDTYQPQLMYELDLA